MLVAPEIRSEQRPVEAPRPESRPSWRSWRLGVPFLLVHLSCIAVVFVGWSPFALAVAGFTYVVRMFGITGFYHRYFCHRSFTLSRRAQFLAACLGASAAQRGPLWWAAHHRQHHRAADRPGDPHSPVQDTLLYSHLLWMFAPENSATDTALVRDLAAYPELRLLDRFHHVVPGLTAAFLFATGVVAGHLWPGLHTSGPQLLVWAFSISTVLVYHATFAVNSIGHRIGRRPFETRDDSRNNWAVALVTLGEGWHNNHHRSPGSARAGFARWEFDPTWLTLRALSVARITGGLRPVPAGVLSAARARRPGCRAAKRAGAVAESTP